jgi:replicative DNA helicase
MRSIDESYFYSPESVEVYRSILRLTAENGQSPTYRLLIEDPDISEEARSHLRDSIATVQNVDDAGRAAKILNKYRQKRGIYNLAAYLGDHISKSKVDIDDLLQKSATALNIIRSRKSTEDSFVHFGKNNSSLKIAQSLLYEDNSEDVIPTGISPFDDASGGLLRGSLFTIGATSGGGKSAMAAQIAINQAEMGYKVLVVPLEMSKREMTARIMANVTGYDVTDILTQRLSTDDRDRCYRKFRKWLKRVRLKGGRLTIFKPEEDMTAEEIMAATAAYNVDVITIDYISLLKGMDGDDQWRQLGAVARYGKINAENQNRVVILLCQVDESGKIRYARAISEHSSNSWIWIATKETKETGLTKIEQPKSRNSKSFAFYVKFDYSKMRARGVKMDSESLGSVSGKEESIPNLAEGSDV